MNTFFTKRTESGQTAANGATANPAQMPSLALYAAAVVAQCAALLAVDTQVNSSGFAAVTISFSIAGVLFSYFLRRRGTAPNFVRVGAVILSLVFLYLLTGRGIIQAITQTDTRSASEMSLATALAFTSTLAMFFLLTDDAVVFLCVWGVAIIGLSATFNVNTQLLGSFAVFLLASIFLLIHHHGLSQRRAELARTPARTQTGYAGAGDNPGARLLGVQATVAALAWGLAIGTGFLIAIPLQMVGRNLSLAAVLGQLRVNQAPRGRRALLPRTAFENSKEFAVGQGPIADDDTPVARVKIGEPAYWRGRTFDYFTGHQWISDVLNERGEPIMDGQEEQGGWWSYKLPPQDDSVVAATRPVNAEVTLLTTSSQSYYAPGQPRSLRLPATMFYRRIDGTLGVGYSAAAQYALVSDVSVATPEQLNASPTNYPGKIVTTYVQQGREISVMLDTLAKEAVGDATKPYDKAEAIRRFIAQRCVYTLDARRVPGNANAVEFFLTVSREGYCDLYASSMVMMCRHAGLPARLITGFSPGEPDPENSSLTLLREQHRHAWAEVYFVGYGWIPFDATLATAVATATPPTPTPLKHTSWLDTLKKLPWQPITLTLAGVGGVGYVVLYEWARRRQPRVRRAQGKLSAVPNRRAMGLYGSALRAARRRGAARGASMSSGEHLALVREHISAAAADALAPLASAHDAALFAPDAGASLDTGVLRAHLKAFHDALRRKGNA